MSQVVYHIPNPETMTSFGRHIGEKIENNIVLLLVGDLGAGKTYIAKAIAEGLGVKEDITSPTFAIMNTYTSGRIPLFHFDLYRLEDSAELDGIGFHEYVRRGVSLVEWANKFEDDMPRCHILIRLEVTGPSSRTVTMESSYFTEADLLALGGTLCI